MSKRAPRKLSFECSSGQVNDAVLGVAFGVGVRVRTVFVWRYGKIVGKVRACALPNDHGLKLTVGPLNYAERHFVRKNPMAKVMVVRKQSSRTKRTGGK